MVFVKLKASHPGTYVKVNVGGRLVQITKRGAEFDDVFADLFTSDSFVVEGAPVKKEPVKEVVVEAPEEKVVVKKKKGLFKK